MNAGACSLGQHWTTGQGGQLEAEACFSWLLKLYATLGGVDLASSMSSSFAEARGRRHASM